MSEISTRKLLGLTALNYLRRPFYARLEVIAFIPVIMQLVIGLTSFSKGSNLLNPLQMMGPMFLAQYVCHQWKQGLAYPQARIIPGYRKMQTIVMVAIFTVYLTLCTTVFWVRNDAASGLMMLAMFLWLINSILAMVVIPRTWWLMFPWMAIWIWLASTDGQQTMAHFLLSYHGLTALGLSLLGLAVAPYLVFVSLRQNDESPGFNRELLAVSTGNRTVGATSTKVDTSFGRFLFGPSDRQLIQSCRRGNTCSRIRRWQVGIVGFRQAIPLGAMSIAVGILLYFLNRHDKSILGSTLCLASIGLPSVLTAASWGWRSTRVATDLMRPVARRDYFRQMFLAAALSAAELWLTLTLLMIVGYLLLDSRAATQIPSTVCLSLTFNMLFFGISAWLSRYGENIPSLAVGFMIVLIPAAVTLMAYLIPEPSSMVFPLVATGFALIGLLLTLDAYRRWRKVEVGLIGNRQRWRNSSMENKPQLAA